MTGRCTGHHTECGAFLACRLLRYAEAGGRSRRQEDGGRSRREQASPCGVASNPHHSSSLPHSRLALLLAAVSIRIRMNCQSRLPRLSTAWPWQAWEWPGVASRSSSPPAGNALGQPGQVAHAIADVRGPQIRGPARFSLGRTGSWSSIAQRRPRPSRAGWAPIVERQAVRVTRRTGGSRSTHISCHQTANRYKQRRRLQKKLALQALSAFRAAPAREQPPARRIAGEDAVRALWWYAGSARAAPTLPRAATHRPGGPWAATVAASIPRSRYMRPQQIRKECLQLRHASPKKRACQGQTAGCVLPPGRRFWLCRDVT